jgi:succinate dehydrogenase / fumarate reductase cytochrome b subunit
MNKDIRPTSPHLSIYRFQITSVLSIMHRMTGIALFAGSALMVLWLYTAAYNPSDYGYLHGLLSSGIGKLLLVGWTLAFYYHLSNGIRHLFWDMGVGFGLAQTTRSGIAVLVFTALLTGATWCPYFFFAQ